MTGMTGMRPPSGRPWARRALQLGAIAALALVFLAYQSPHTVLDLANRVWACF